MLQFGRCGASAIVVAGVLFGGIAPAFAQVEVVTPAPRAPGAAAPAVVAGGAQPATVRPPPQEYKTAEEEYNAFKRRAGGGTKHTWATLPDWSGVWVQSGGLGYGRPTPAPLNAEYRAKYDLVQANLAKGIEYDRLAECIPAGHPRWVSEPYNKEFYPMPDRTLLVQEFMNENRFIYTDGRQHTPADELVNTWEGDSIGFWDKDTLVIWTAGLKAGDYQRDEPEYTDQTQTVERWRKIDPDTIEIQMTVFDPGSLTKPWHVAKLYRRNKVPDQRIRYWECVENNTAVRTPEGGTTNLLPGQPGFREPRK